jgi:hypothetical protein
MKVSRRDLLAGAAAQSRSAKPALQVASRPPTRPRCAANRAVRSASERHRKAATPAARRHIVRHTASGSVRHDHASRPALRAASRRRARDRSEGLLAADPRHGRAADGRSRSPDLKRFPAVSRVHFLECSGNFGGRGTATDLTPQQIAGLTSTSEWTGVPLATLFREVGASPKATWFLAEGSGRRGAHAQRADVEGLRRCA